MARERKWYSKYIGYQFADGGILEDVFYFTDDNGKPAGTGYEMYYPETGKYTIMGYAAFKKIADSTVLPK